MVDSREDSGACVIFLSHRGVEDGEVAELLLPGWEWIHLPESWTEILPIAKGRESGIKIAFPFKQPTITSMNEGDWRDRVVSDADIHHGEPCIRGTRISVAVIVASLADLTIDDLLSEFPQLTREDVKAALLYAAESAHNTMVA